MPLTAARRIPVATYRLQLRREFPFAEVSAHVPHLHGLGITDCYLSPIFLSSPGSSHGYDVNDYRRIDPELGGRAGLEHLHAELRARDMGLLLDFVPNHMGINGPESLNRWWRDVLENGQHSPYARYFDINWSGNSTDGRPRVLVPVLDDHYGRVLEQGRLALNCAAGTLTIAFGEMTLPVTPQTYCTVLAPLATGASAEEKEMRALVDAFGALPKPDAAEDIEAAKIRTERTAELKRRFSAMLESSASIRPRVEARLRELNGVVGNPRSFDALDRVIGEQHYRLAFWKAGIHETNYRRFFAIDSLIGLRIEIPEVFRETHALLTRLVREEIVTGLRIDHIDGLRDPAEYLGRLQTLAPELAGEKSGPLYVVTEKILAENELLPPAWEAHGTTGYEFIAQLAGIFVDPAAEPHFTRSVAEFCGEHADFDDVVYQKKRLVLDEMFANAVTLLTNQFAEIVQEDRRWRDVTRHELLVAVRELMAGHGVYRTYRRHGETMGAADQQIVAAACRRALARNRWLAAEPFELVCDVLTGVYPAAEAATIFREALTEWTLSFQQYTGAVMAKAVEDTAFYTDVRFVALNEVGGNPRRFGGTVSEFHAANRQRLHATPHTLLATATHDTKLGEDTRARLYALSEIPHEWREWAADWRRLNARHKTSIEGRMAPDANEEYRLYQILLGAWPTNDAPPDDAFRTRMREHLRKAMNEAKRNTWWLHQNEPWLAAGDRFVDAILGEESGRDFLRDFRPRAIRLARLGWVNSLAQVVLKITSPGVPDFYQGSEQWDLSLVDPDNRRPVDFARHELIAQRSAHASVTELLSRWRDGAIKLHVMRALLRFRGKHAALFQRGDYRPLETGGRFAENVVAFARVLGDAAVVVLAPRLTAHLGAPPLGLVWDDTAVLLEATKRSWKDVVTGRNFPATTKLSLAAAFAELPFAVLAAE